VTVLVIGGANLDVLARSSGPLRAHTSNPGTTVRTYGGVGRNVAENLARFGNVPVEAVPWLHAMWTGKPVSWFVGWECSGHVLNHIGEMVSVRNRLGLSPF